MSADSNDVPHVDHPQLLIIIFKECGCCFLFIAKQPHCQPSYQLLLYTSKAQSPPHLEALAVSVLEANLPKFMHPCYKEVSQKYYLNAYDFPRTILMTI